MEQPAEKTTFAIGIALLLLGLASVALGQGSYPSHGFFGDGGAAEAGWVPMTNNLIFWTVHDAAEVDITNGVYVDVTSVPYNGAQTTAANRPAYTTNATGMGICSNDATDYYWIPDRDELTFTNGFTLNMWMKRALDDAAEGIMRKGINSTADNYEFQFFFESYGSGYIIFHVGDTTEGGYIGRYTTTDFNSGDGWTMVTGVWDGTDTSAGCSFYTNAVRADTANSEDGTFVAMRNTAYNLYVTRQETSEFIGEHGSAMGWNTALTPSMVTNLYDNTKAWYGK